MMYLIEPAAVGGTWAEFQTVVSSLGYAVRHVYYAVNLTTGNVDNVFATFISDFHNVQLVGASAITPLTPADVLAVYPTAISAYLNSISDTA